MTRKIKYHIIGPRNNWVITKTTIVTLGILLSTAFFFVIGLSIYQYLHHEREIKKLQQSHEKETSLTKRFENNIERLEKEISSLQEKLNEKKQLLTNLQTAEKVGTQKQIASEEKISNYLLQINELQKTLKKKNSLINNLKNQQKNNTQKIISLSSQIKDLQQHLQKLSSKDDSYLPIEINEQPLIIDQLQISSSDITVFVQFNLKNTSQEVQSGHVSIIPLSKDQLNQEIEFGEFRTFPFLIKRFRPFSKEFEQQDNLPFTAIRIIVWDQNKNTLLNENYFIP